MVKMVNLTLGIFYYIFLKKMLKRYTNKLQCVDLIQIKQKKYDIYETIGNLSTNWIF